MEPGITLTATVDVRTTVSDRSGVMTTVSRVTGRTESRGRSAPVGTWAAAEDAQKANKKMQCLAVFPSTLKFSFVI